MKDYYSILKIPNTANGLEIKKGYRKFALEFHPDINKSPEAHALFIEINEAYHVLNNHRLRKLYDQIYHNFKTNSSFQYEQNESKVKSAAQSGQAKGEKFANQSGNSFKRRVKSWRRWTIVDVVLEFVWLILQMF